MHSQGTPFRTHRRNIKSSFTVLADLHIVQIALTLVIHPQTTANSEFRRHKETLNYRLVAADSAKLKQEAQLDLKPPTETLIMTTILNFFGWFLSSLLLLPR